VVDEATMAIDGEEALSWLVQRFPELEEPFASERASHPELNLHVMWDIMFRVVFEPMMAADPPAPRDWSRSSSGWRMSFSAVTSR
jgi:hypothetical protein